MTCNFIKNLEIRLNQKLPGRVSQNRMAPLVNRENRPLQTTGKAGVLILIFPRKGELSTLLIKRTEYPGPHSGQVSLPGGKREITDRSIIYTALREAGEETGIDAGDITVLGTLTPLYVHISNLEVSPVVGYTDRPPDFRINSKEVEYLILISLKNLLGNTVKTEKNLKIRDEIICAPGYLIDNEYVWGATAMILSEFIEIINNAGASNK